MYLQLYEGSPNSFNNFKSISKNALFECIATDELTNWSEIQINSTISALTIANDC